MSCECGTLTAAKLAHATPAHILKEMWWKFMINVGVNQASAVLGVKYAEFKGHVAEERPQARRLLDALQAEVLAVSQPAAYALEIRTSRGGIKCSLGSATR